MNQFLALLHHPSAVPGGLSTVPGGLSTVPGGLSTVPAGFSTVPATLPRLFLYRLTLISGGRGAGLLETADKKRREPEKSSPPSLAGMEPAHIEYLFLGGLI
jgi:hypothetical protein